MLNAYQCYGLYSGLLTESSVGSTPRLINQRVIEGQGQVEELQKNLQEQGVKADDVSTAPGIL